MSVNKEKQIWEQVGTVVALNCYPVKSCREIPVEQAFCTKLGLKVDNAVDRHWMVVRSNGDFVNARQAPTLLQVQIAIQGQELVVNGPAMPTLTLPLAYCVDRKNVMKCRVWKEQVEGLDCGDDGAHWFSNFLNIFGLRLVYSSIEIKKQDLTNAHKPSGDLSLPGDQAAFSDYCGYLITTVESLKDLNTHLEREVMMDRFRPSIVIQDSPPYDEDSWAELKIGDFVTIRILDPCTRCLVTTIDPETGTRDPQQEPLQTLKSYRCFPKYGSSPLFGVNATVDREGTISVGDTVYTIRRDLATAAE